MVETEAPSPLGWCVQCLLRDEQTAAETVYEGDGVCHGCLDELTGASEHEERPPAEHADADRSTPRSDELTPLADQAGSAAGD